MKETDDLLNQIIDALDAVGDMTFHRIDGGIDREMHVKELLLDFGSLLLALFSSHIWIDISSKCLTEKQLRDLVSLINKENMEDDNVTIH